MRATQLLHDLGQSLWLDNITRDLLNDGSLQVDSSFTRWAIAIKPGSRPLSYSLRTSSFRCEHAEHSDHAGARRCVVAQMVANPASVHLSHETGQPYKDAVHDSLSGIASTARRLGKVSDHSPK
jgi:hypothetical protein